MNQHAVRHILAHVKPGDADFSRSNGLATISAGLALAKRFKARLDVVYTIRRLMMLEAYFGKQSSVYARASSEEFSRAAAMRRWFEDLRAQEDVSDAQWQVCEGDAAAIIARAAHFQDLVIISRSDPRTDDIGFDVPETVLLKSGRPVLILPHGNDVPGEEPQPTLYGQTCTVTDLGRRIVVGWNSTREAALAIHAALPFLIGAEHVKLVHKAPEASPDIVDEPAFNMRRYFLSHGIQAQLQPLDADHAEAGKALLEIAHRERADMLVAGGYGHSWLREWVAGGATRYMLEHARLPLFMCH